MSQTGAQSPDDGQEETYRYERKFTLPQFNEAVFRHYLRMNPAGFRETYPPRHVNNLYFDTIGYENLFDNVEGVGDRAKTRVRWYGDLLGKVESPFLEYKLKRGLVGTKRRFDLRPFELGRMGEAGKVIMAAVRAASLPGTVAMDMRHVRPTLLNRYRREYYQACPGFRLTMDTDQEYYCPTRDGRSVLAAPQMVVELKYDVELESEADRVLDGFGLRVMKNSKYLTGVMSVGY